ncbi:NAD(P)H-hydrate dehydratase [Bacillaceae bacterium SIJ1]|uniref:NAD(P)H-hydrate dehydratase n=1 Tax=Litoribacterium kuwaitense TaxID=1398745 RepID=UPI0013E9D69E|nr:NAD(P)H-hydrate dehydratase [Litoribacterium kuwaitense]NGP46253.1 NAD(P)H-hydrate dehydratase [Litoribacterium kuwaitense]
MKIVTAQDMYKVDRWTMEAASLPEVLLMENAGRALGKELEVEKGSVLLLAGKGNNGGDAIAAARFLAECNREVALWLLHPPEDLSQTAQKHLHAYIKAGHAYDVYSAQEPEPLFLAIEQAEVVVDAMLGLGAKGAPRPPCDELIKRANQAQGRRIAVDIPSGVAHALHEGPVFKADETFTLHAPKQSAFEPQWTPFYGKLHVLDIGIPKKAFDVTDSALQLWEWRDVLRTFPQKPDDAHKGTSGKACLFAGSPEMPGAAVLAGKAALRGGAGLTTLALPKSLVSMVTQALTEATYLQCQEDFAGSFSGVLPDVTPFDAIAVGPGVGRQQGSARLVEQLMRRTKAPLVMDADALYHLSRHLEDLKHRTWPTILTPHPGEMARLCGLSIKEVQADRFRVSRDFAKMHRIYLVLKGPHTLITTPEGRQFVNSTGNAALAKGGTGDVLTGLVTALLMVHDHIDDALCNAVYLHGKAADTLVDRGHSMIGVVATDVINTLSSVLCTVENQKSI